MRAVRRHRQGRERRDGPPGAAGTRGRGILDPLTDVDLAAIKYYHFAEGEVAGMPMIVSRTGYTGEDGFELYHDVQYSLRLWDALMAAGNVTPAGLGARDTLRLEMGMALYGNDIDDTVTPLEANLAWLVKLKKGDFVGSAVLEEQKANGVAKKLVGFTLRRPQHRPPRLSGVRRERAERRGLQRHDEPHAGHPHRHVLPADGAEQGREHLRRGDPRQARSGHRRQDAVLQGCVASMSAASRDC